MAGTKKQAAGKTAPIKAEPKKSTSVKGAAAKSKK
jgi:hypothetical protein